MLHGIVGQHEEQATVQHVSTATALLRNATSGHHMGTHPGGAWPAAVTIPMADLLNWR